MNRLLLGLTAGIIILLISMFVVQPDLRLYYKNNEGRYQQAGLINITYTSNLSLALWTERNLSRLLFMTPPANGTTMEAWRRIESFVPTSYGSNNFYRQLTAIDFFKNLVDRERHSFFAPTKHSVVVGKNKISTRFYIQTQGVLTFRSSGAETSFPVVFQMLVEVDPLTGDKGFVNGWVKRV